MDNATVFTGNERDNGLFTKPDEADVIFRLS